MLFNNTFSTAGVIGYDGHEGVNSYRFGWRRLWFIWRQYLSKETLLKLKIWWPETQLNSKRVPSEYTFRLLWLDHSACFKKFTLQCLLYWVVRLRVPIVWIIKDHRLPIELYSKFSASREHSGKDVLRNVVGSGHVSKMDS